MTGTEIYKRSAAFEREAESIRLHAPQWKLLLAYDGQRSLAEVALSSEVAFIDALPLTEKFLGSGWIEEQPITLDQYLKRTGAASASAVGSSVTPPVVLHEPKSAAQISPTPAALASPAPVAPVPASAPGTVAAPMPDPFVRAEEPAPVRAAPVPPPPSPKPILPPPLKASPPPAAPVAAVSPAPKPVAAQPQDRLRGPMRLKGVVDFIVSQVGNSSLGQLVVYRVFLRVPPHLLQAEDIASVHLLNDQSVVNTEELKQAIASSVMEVVKRPLPESVFAAA